MLRALDLFASTCLAVALTACLSYPEAVTIEERDASVLPERPAEPVALETDDGGAASDVERDAASEPPPPPPGDAKPCDECPPGTRCCTKGGKGKGKGKGGEDREIVCEPATAECDD